jgi:hypothetical protein
MPREILLLVHPTLELALIVIGSTPLSGLVIVGAAARTGLTESM